MDWAARRGADVVLHVPADLADVLHAEPRYDEHHVHVHESPKNMTVPLMILAVPLADWRLVCTAGPCRWRSELLRGLPFAGVRSFRGAGGEVAAFAGTQLSIVAVVAATAGLIVAWRMYTGKVKRGPSDGLHKILYNKYYVDELYQAVIVGPLVWLSRNVLWKVVDVGVIDGTVNGIAHGTTAVGDTVRQTQSGNTRSYAVWVLVGALVVFAIIFWPILHPAVFGGAR